MQRTLAGIEAEELPDLIAYHDHLMDTLNHFPNKYEVTKDFFKPEALMAMSNDVLRLIATNLGIEVHDEYATVDQYLVCEILMFQMDIIDLRFYGGKDQGGYGL